MGYVSGLKKRLLALGLAGFLSLTSCSEVDKQAFGIKDYKTTPLITEGEIYDKNYEPARREDKYDVLPVGGAAMPVLVSRYDDPDYIIKIRKWNPNKYGRGKRAKGGYDTEKFYVDKLTYKRLKKGDHFKYNGTNAELEDNH